MINHKANKDLMQFMLEEVEQAPNDEAESDLPVPQPATTVQVDEYSHSHRLSVAAELHPH